MTCFARAAAALACGVLLAGSAAGQTTTQTRQVTSTTTTIHKGSVLTGATVVVQDGATIGRVEDFVISDGGCIDYVVVSYDGKFVLVPWGAATWSADRTVRVNVTREKFREVPTFTRDQWPNLQDTQYVQRVRTVFGVTESRYGDPNRRPLDRREDRRDERRDIRDERRDDRKDRRDDARDPQRRDVENKNRTPPKDRPKDQKDRPKDPPKDPPR
jgi:PRC-barrel domain